MASNRTRRCAATRKDGQPCRMAPLLDSEFCWAHAPEHQEEAAAARRAGGQVKKKQGTLALAYDLNGLETIADIRRWLEVVMFETLGLENTISRNRAIMNGTQIAAQLHEKGELADRIDKLEAIHKHPGPEPPLFQDHDDVQVGS
jgi:hypothetical protein